MDYIYRLLSEVFTDDMGFSAFKGINKNSIDEEELEKTGTITKTFKEENGLVTETIDYESFDGETKFSKIHTYYKNQEIDFKINGIEEQIHQALLEENYEKAAELKKEKENLLNSKERK